jgi:hypothetical protein
LFLSAKPDDKSSDFGLEEWKAARSIFEKFDDRIGELRKFGFTFLSGLIAADALTELFSAPDDRVRLGVVGITLLLTVALMVLDKNYQLFQSAAGIRAKNIEVNLNLELTEILEFRSGMDNFKNYVLAVYLSFAAVAGLVGILLFYPNAILLLFTSGLTIIAGFAIYVINGRKPDLERQVDWTLNRTRFKVGEKIRITVTNICPGNSVSFLKGKPVWKIRKEGDEKTDVYVQDNPNGIIITKQNNFSWELVLDKFEHGIYRIFPSDISDNQTQELWDRPLKRAIIVEP